MVSATAMLIRLLIFIFVIVLIDLYVFSGVKTITSGMAKGRHIVHWVYWGVNIALILFMLYVMLTFSQTRGPQGRVSLLMGLMILFVVPKLVFGVFLLLEDIYRFARLGIEAVLPRKMDSPGVSMQGRRQFLSYAGAVAAAVPFFAILHGITKGKYNFKVHNVTLRFPDLPSAFHGFTIAQISDVHAGSFDSRESVTKGVEMLNAQKPDMIVFTGDLVNNMASEMEEWIDVFKKLDAPFGKFSVFGNHDYGDYIKWESPSAKEANLRRLAEIHQEMGFRLMRNENYAIEKSGERFSLVGIENWGLPPFPQYGNLTKALQGTEPDSFKVLLSHDPSHFDAEVIHKKELINLTLSGHTHGMQFGIEIPGFRWSPVKYRYPRWAGLYEVEQRYLYVNRGFGFLGFPGRVGIWPEITIIRLEKA